MKSEESGIKRVLEAYFKHLPDYGIELVPRETKRADFDLLAVHAGTYDGDTDVAHVHGFYWSADYQCAAWEWYTNKSVVQSIRYARAVTVPSEWVAETIMRDFRFRPDVIGHGIDWEAWQQYANNDQYVLWNKNRAVDVCDPAPMIELAKRFPNRKFITTLTSQEMDNIHPQGILPHDEMKRLIMSACVYLSTTKETFGIGVLEAMASGVPTLGWRNGGNVTLIEHGVNGYLAEPGNYDDLAEGLDYCYRYRRILGDNAREMAKRWTWEAACEKVAGIYRRVLIPPEPDTAIVIPTYNHAERVGRAVKSALAQTSEHVKKVIVVDDGSTDNTRERMQEILALDDRVEYIHQPNAGVAHARNRGIKRADELGYKYVCCLDADDAIEPQFADFCIRELENDPTLGIAYTGLHWINPDGSEGNSAWPGDYDFEMQLKHKNQVPTCCVFRVEAWRRLGGFRQRYAPHGAGSEDAEFWTRMGAYGYGARKASPKPLFIYSWQSGIVSGNKDYKEVDWLAWHPWAKDKLHPLPSVAKPKRWSHPAREYDEPMVSVVIPVGPGHAGAIINALDSLDAQTLRRWEAIVVWDTPPEEENEDKDYIRTTFPFIREVQMEKAPAGAGAARNAGANIARAPFLLFLDADDWLFPHALHDMVQIWQSEESIIYSDYVGKAFIGDISKLDPRLQKRIYHRDEKTGETVIGYKAHDYDCQRAQAQPTFPKPYIWCNVTALIPTEWHKEIGGFDEEMKSWEDWDYHIRMARAGKCYHRLEDELLVYRFYSGSRREYGLKYFKELTVHMQSKYEREKLMPCPGGCGGRSPARVPVRTQIPGPRSTSEVDMKDDDYLKVRYLHPNRGQHMVVGGATHTKYGMRGGGEEFLVHRSDVEAQPHLFEVARPIRPPKSATVRAPASVSLRKPKTIPESQMPPPKPMTPPDISKMDLEALPGVGKKVAEALRAQGVESAADILELGVEGMQKLDRIGPVTAERIVDAIHRLSSVSS